MGEGEVGIPLVISRGEGKGILALAYDPVVGMAVPERLGGCANEGEELSPLGL